MLMKVVLPKGAEVLQNDNNEIIVKMPQFYVEYQTITVFTVKGQIIEDFYNNPSISNQEILMTSGGMLEVEN